MKKFASAIHGGLLLACMSALICVHSAAQVAVNPAAVPQDQLLQTSWKARHELVLKEVAEHPGASLLMLGDSITQNYTLDLSGEQNYKAVWNEFYAPRGAINLGFNSDMTSNLLWRIGHGELSGLHPKVAVILIGTNNTGWANQTAEQAEGGIDAVVASVELRLPETQILLLGILPSSVSPQKTARDQEVNRYLATSYGESHRVTYLDIGSIFYDGDNLRTSLFANPGSPKPGPALYPTAAAQRMMAEAIEPTLAKLMHEPPRVPLESVKDVNYALIPVDALESDFYDWYGRHHQVLEEIKKQKPRVVLIGDSITHLWGGMPVATKSNGPNSWKLVFGQMDVLNLGFGWDRTQNVLWRLRQGEFDGLDPDWVVLNIGTNNFAGTSHARACTPAQVVDGIAAIVDQVHHKSPRSRIIVMAIFPRGEKPDNRFRALINEANGLLRERFGSKPEITFLNIGANFLQPNGTLPREMMSDGTHPTDAGYRIWASALIEAGIKP